ncbi:hypothetical protein KUTeg_002819 [Tegillarca granosa]|uniref:Integrase catalytic domain-containing protein n=1 Tax=Tegillarca granosa TaxID=220873 RepID=A0ABQ9FQT2_TEGGR|nr:hypothetical protein KUTeg_002819 [Tegillarca granosa]
MLSQEEQDYLKAIWTDPSHPGSFAGPHKLYKIVRKEGKFNIGLKRIRQFLSDQDAYSLQKRVQRKFPRNRVIVEGIDAQWDCDLMDLKNLSKWNEKIQYILVAQDVFSRYVFAVPMKQKTGQETVKGFKEIFSSGRKPKMIRADKGSEFKNKWVKNFLKNQGVHLIFTQNETKSNYAERSIQNIKNRFYRMFTETKSYEYLSKLTNLIKSINDTPSRPLKGMAPSEVNDRNESEVRLNQYLVRTKTKLHGNITKQPKSEKKPRKKRNRPVFKYKINDLVRITHLKRPFMREYDQKWTGEVFKVSKRIKREGIPTKTKQDQCSSRLDVSTMNKAKEIIVDKSLSLEAAQFFPTGQCETMSRAVDSKRIPQEHVCIAVRRHLSTLQTPKDTKPIVFWNGYGSFDWHGIQTLIALHAKMILQREVEEEKIWMAEYPNKFRNLDFPDISSIEMYRHYVWNQPKSATKNVLVSNAHEIGSHWSYCTLTTDLEKGVYIDSLGWQVPSNLMLFISPLLKSVAEKRNIKFQLPEHLNTLHSTSTEPFHVCNKTCNPMAPFQTCGNICGVVAIALCALSLNKPKWEALIMNKTSNNDLATYEVIKNPSEHAKYLRFCLMSWIAAGNVNVNNICKCDNDSEEVEQFQYATDVGVPESNVSIETLNVAVDCIDKQNKGKETQNKVKIQQAHNKSGQKRIRDAGDDAYIITERKRGQCKEQDITARDNKVPIGK